VASAMHRAASEMIGRSVADWTIAEQRTLTALLTRLTLSQAGGTSAV